MKINSLFAAIAIAIGLQSAMLWGMNDLAISGAQQASQTSLTTNTATLMPKPAEIRQPCPVTLPSVTIVARRLTPLIAPNLAAVEKPAAPRLHASEIHCVDTGRA
jgi:hypothetical protein